MARRDYMSFTVKRIVSKFTGWCYVPTLGTYDTSATTAWYTLNPIIVINNRPPIIQDVFI